mgnify:CR=1 FL=1
MENRKDDDAMKRRLTRRGFLAGGALLGTGMIGPAVTAAENDEPVRVLNTARPDAAYPLVKGEHIIHSVCLQCNTGCGIKCKLVDGIVTKIDGNPYNPWTLHPHLPYDTPLAEAVLVDGSICPKGQAGLQTAYDPYRIRKVLKRAGKRGENRWITISFEEAVKEICEGGYLFKHVPGEEKRYVEGLKDLVALRDPGLAVEMKKDVDGILNEKDHDKKRALVEAFKNKFSEHLDLLIDPDHPDLGPKNNQIVLAWGRLKDGRGDLYKRFAAALGTVNAHGHTTVCQGSLYFTCKAISEQYVGGKFSQGAKFYWQADLDHAEFVLFVGANLFEANYGPPNRAVRITERLATKQAKIAVADPRFSKLASKAWKWLPIKPGTDAALALAVMRWMFEHGGYDAKFLSAANRAAAAQIGDPAWSNATWLVACPDGKPGKFVRAADISIDGTPLRASEKRRYLDETSKKEVEYEEKFMVVMSQGTLKAVDPNDDQEAVFGDLFVDTKLPDGTPAKSALQILKEEAFSRSFEEWCEICGVPAKDVAAVARELVSHGRKSAVDIHRGAAQHTNGFYNVLAWMTVNILLGNIGAKGGMLKAATYDHKKGVFDLTQHPSKAVAFGISCIRHEVSYEQTTIFDGYPAKRPWYPLSSDVYEEIIPSIGDKYPYPVKALFLYMGAPPYALPAGHTNIEILADVEKLPLFIANDILVGSASMYADYIFPDLSFLERWEFHGSHPNIPHKVQPIRQPVIAPIPEECAVFGQKLPLSFEAMIFGIAEYLKLPGFGPGGLGADKNGQPLDLNHPDDFYLRAVANLAWGDQPDGSTAVPDAADEEVEIFLKARRHLPQSVFDAARWKRIVGKNLWRKVVYVLNRGGRFEAFEKAFSDTHHTHAFKGLLNIYQEKTATTIHSGTGVPHPGFARYIPVRDYLGREPSELQKGYEFHLITHRAISQTKSRTIVDPWLTPLLPENVLLINPRDLAKLGLKSGQRVRIVSATNPQGEWDFKNGTRRAVIAKLHATQTIRPGIVSFALGFGHWATGSSDIEIDGHIVRGEARRKAGFHANAVMWVDPVLKNTCMLDPVGGSVSFYDTYVRLEPVG